MNKIPKKILLIFSLIIISFFIFSSVSIAASATWYNVRCIGDNKSKFYLPNVARDNGYMRTDYIGIYSVGGQHAYCIQPGVTIKPSGYSNKNLENYNSGYFNNNAQEKRRLIQQILTFAKKLNDPPSSGLSKEIQTKCANPKDYQEVFAAQVLIWEVVTGQRTSFDHWKPESDCKNCFYSKYVNGENSYLATEYRRIVDSCYYAFRPDQIPSNFRNTKSVPGVKTIPLAWDGKKYTITLKDDRFKYWESNTEDSSGLNVNVSNNSVTISSKSPISENNPKTVEIKVKNKNSGGTAQAYYQNEAQDLVSIYGTTTSAYLRVNTPKYQLKITKKASLDGKVLSGTKFNICSNSSCTKILGTVTTDKNGTATFQSIPSPGTYYVKEIAAPQGYELDSTPRAVTVSSSSIAGSSSYGVITLTDANKVFNLTKKTVDENGNVIDLDDGCGTDNYTGPEFEIKENGSSLYFKEIKPGEYDVSSKDADGATTKLRTCKGKFKVYTLPKCNYTISETKAPEGLTLPSEPTKAINVCGSGKNVSFTNGFAGLEFQKKDEDGNFVEGGKFSLQRRVNNVYRDILLKQVEDGSYVYDANLKEEDEGATYIILTNKGIARISKLAPGEYRVVEKEAPEGFELIQDKDSKSLVTIKDSDKEGYYLVEMIDQKVRKNGSKSSAELVVTITTGRKVPNYILIISALVIMLVIAILIRKKIKK